MSCICNSPFKILDNVNGQAECPTCDHDQAYSFLEYVEDHYTISELLQRSPNIMQAVTDTIRPSRYLTANYSFSDYLEDNYTISGLVQKSPEIMRAVAGAFYDEFIRWKYNE